MTHVLLTGAGFSKNWGGLVAVEFFSRLLGEELDEETRNLLFETRTLGGFETVMTRLQEASKNSSTDKKRLDDFTAAVVGIFNFMNNHFLRAPLNSRTRCNTWSAHVWNDSTLYSL